MKKLSLMVTMAAVLATSTSMSFAEETDAAGLQIFKKEITLLVQKDSELSADFDYPVDDTNNGADDNTHEMVDIQIDDLMASPNSDHRTFIGSMILNTTSDACEATITTSNGFTLKGVQLGEALAQYNIEYMADPVYLTGGTPTAIPSMVAFGENHPVTQPVNCSTANLHMAILNMNSNAPVDAYDDIITVEVRAES